MALERTHTLVGSTRLTFPLETPNSRDRAFDRERSTGYDNYARRREAECKARMIYGGLVIW